MKFKILSNQNGISHEIQDSVQSPLLTNIFSASVQCLIAELMKFFLSKIETLMTEHGSQFGLFLTK